MDTHLILNLCNALHCLFLLESNIAMLLLMTIINAKMIKLAMLAVIRNKIDVLFKFLLHPCLNRTVRNILTVLLL